MMRPHELKFRFLAPCEVGLVAHEVRRLEQVALPHREVELAPVTRVESLVVFRERFGRKIVETAHEVDFHHVLLLLTRLF